MFQDPTNPHGDSSTVQGQSSGEPGSSWDTRQRPVPPPILTPSLSGTPKIQPKVAALRVETPKQYRAFNIRPSATYTSDDQSSGDLCSEPPEPKPPTQPPCKPLRATAHKRHMPPQPPLTPRDSLGHSPNQTAPSLSIRPVMQPTGLLFPVTPHSHMQTDLPQENPLRPTKRRKLNPFASTREAKQTNPLAHAGEAPDLSGRPTPKSRSTPNAPPLLPPRDTRDPPKVRPTVDLSSNPSSPRPSGGFINWDSDISSSDVHSPQHPSGDTSREATEVVPPTAPRPAHQTPPKTAMDPMRTCAHSDQPQEGPPPNVSGRHKTPPHKKYRTTEEEKQATAISPTPIGGKPPALPADPLPVSEKHSHQEQPESTVKTNEVGTPTSAPPMAKTRAHLSDAPHAHWPWYYGCATRTTPCAISYATR